MQVEMTQQPYEDNQDPRRRNVILSITAKRNVYIDPFPLSTTAAERLAT